MQTKAHLVKAMVFPVVMHGCESWTTNKAESQRIDAFELWCWRRLLSPLNCKEIKAVNPKGNQSWIFIGRTDAEAEAPIFWLLDAQSRLFRNKTLMLGKIKGRRQRGWQRMRWLMASPTQWTWVWASCRRWWRTGKPGVLQPMGLQRVGHDWATEHHTHLG